MAVAPKAMQKSSTGAGKGQPPSILATSDPAAQAVHAATLAEAKVAAARDRQAVEQAHLALAAAEQKMANTQVAKAAVRAEVVKELEDEVG